LGIGAVKNGGLAGYASLIDPLLDPLNDEMGFFLLVECGVN